jgi:hypothetical protein
MSRWERIRLGGAGVLSAWALWNAGVVYLAFGGERQHRLETALFLLLAYLAVSEIALRAVESSPKGAPIGALTARDCRFLVGRVGVGVARALGNDPGRPVPQ